MTILSNDILNIFPYEVNLHILSYLNKSDLCLCELVSKSWQKVANEDVLWKTVAMKLYAHPLIAKKCFKMEAKMIILKNPYSNDILKYSIEAFLDKISTMQNAKFSCTFPSSSQTLEIVIKDKNILREHFDLEEACIGTHEIGEGSLKTYISSTGKIISRSCSTYTTATGTVHRGTIPLEGRFEYTLNYPLHLTPDSDLENHIVNIVQLKLDSFYKQTDRIYRIASFLENIKNKFLG